FSALEEKDRPAPLPRLHSRAWSGRGRLERALIRGPFCAAGLVGGLAHADGLSSARRGPAGVGRVTCPWWSVVGLRYRQQTTWSAELWRGYYYSHGHVRRPADLHGRLAAQIHTGHHDDATSG